MMQFRLTNNLLLDVVSHDNGEAKLMHLVLEVLVRFEVPWWNIVSFIARNIHDDFLIRFFQFITINSWLQELAKIAQP